MIRKDTSVSKDDKITIRKNLETGDFALWYMDSNVSGATYGPPITQHLEGLYFNKVLEHMYVAIKSMALDEEGFMQAQFDIPGIPRMLVSVANMKDVYYRDHLNDMIRVGLDVMDNDMQPSCCTDNTVFKEPCETSTATNKVGKKRRTRCSTPPTPRHMYFDVEDV